MTFNFEDESSNHGLVRDITLDLLQVAFIVLKVVGLIDWGWGEVLIPLWIEIGYVVLFITITVISTIISNKFNR